MKFLFTFTLIFMLNCSAEADQISERETLDKLKKEILTIADQSICSDEYTCKTIGLGSKPCGGNWEYLIYTNSIDEEDLLFKVSHYNSLEKKYNIKWNIVSDCSVVTPPESIGCENGKCVAIN